MTKINKYIKGQFNEVVFERDGQEHTVFIIEGLVYTKTKELFTGEITGKHNAKVIEGKFEGKVNSYFSDEELFSASKEEEPYKGQKYEKKIYVETFYKDGKKNGQYVEYHANGPLHIKTYYKDDKLDGEYLKYNRAGILDIEEHYKEGRREGECKYYIAGTIKKKGSFKKDILIGEMIEYNRDGVVISGKTGEVLSYHENGKLRTIENYKNGKRHGEFIRYDKNGQTISQSTYKDGTLL